MGGFVKLLCRVCLMGKIDLVEELGNDGYAARVRVLNLYESREERFWGSLMWKVTRHFLQVREALRAAPGPSRVPQGQPPTFPGQTTSSKACFLATPYDKYITQYSSIPIEISPFNTY